MTPKDLQASGQIALEQGLIDLPQFSANTTGAGPFIGGSGEVNLDLRYLGPQRNLVLLDGRRLLPSSADGTVDLNQLPQGIIGGVDVITGGASAVYGSDAVSGVVNFRTKKPFNGLDVTTSYGTTEQYGGSQFDVNGVGGFETDDGKGSLIFAVEYTQRDHVNSASIPYLVQYGNYPVPMASGEFTPGSNALSQSALNNYFGQFGAPAGNVSRSELLGFNNNGTLYNVGKNAVAPFNVYNLIPQTDPQGRPLEDVLAGSVHHKSYASWSQLPLTRWSAFTKGDWTIFPGVHAYIQGLYTDYTSKINVEPTVTSGLQIPTVPVTNPFIPADLAGLLASRTHYNHSRQWRPSHHGRTGRALQLVRSLLFLRLPHDHQPKPYLPVRRRPGRDLRRYHDLGSLWQPWPDDHRLCQHWRGALQRHSAIAERA